MGAAIVHEPIYSGELKSNEKLAEITLIDRQKKTMIFNARI